MTDLNEIANQVNNLTSQIDDAWEKLQESIDFSELAADEKETFKSIFAAGYLTGFGDAKENLGNTRH